MCDESFIAELTQPGILTIQYQPLVQNELELFGGLNPWDP